MMIYVVLLNGLYDVPIEKIFTTKDEAEAYRAELQKQHPCYCFSVEEYWVA